MEQNIDDMKTGRTLAENEIKRVQDMFETEMHQLGYIEDIEELRYLPSAVYLKLQD